MIQDCKFDKSRDLGVTIHGLSPDLNKIIESGTVPDSEAEPPKGFPVSASEGLPPVL